jgi:hypothetical protein
MTRLIRNIELHSRINYAASMPYTVIYQQVEILLYSNMLRCYQLVPQIYIYIYIYIICIYHRVTAKATFTFDMIQPRVTRLAKSFDG